MSQQDHPDLTACDREAIHVPGSIQPHGVLLVADAATLRVVAGAGDLEGRLRPDWLGQPLETLLGQDFGPQLAGHPAAGPLFLDRRVAGAREIFDAVLHRQDGRLLVELEPAGDPPLEAIALLGRLDAHARGFEQAGDLANLCDRAASAFRALTGFDRVMVYRFIDDEAGQVVAEERRADLASFLHHHFPGGDIPRQARALYIRNRARSIPRVDYRPAPLRPDGFAQLDLSDVVLRSISPIHLQYLRNMGVGASASFSIVRDGILWGMVTCHHETPRRLSRDVMAAGSALTNALARQIQAKELAAAYAARLRLRAAVDDIAAEFTDERGTAQLFRDLGKSLCGLLDGDGFAYVARGTVQLHGIGPDEEAIAALATWAAARSPGEPLVTRRLAGLYPPAADWPRRASGLLFLPLAEDGRALLWFRVEEPETVRWAGNPHKDQGAGGPLTPRTSFATWVETVRGRARAWTLEEIDAARRLGRAFTAARSNRRVRRLNRDLQTALTERDALLRQKDLLMREVDHRVQNSLQIVGAYLALQAREVGPGAVAAHLAEAKARLSAVALVHQRLYRADQRETLDAGQYLGEVLDALRAALGAEWEGCVTAELAPVLVPGDRAMSLGLVMTELVLNASKYAYAGRPGPIDVRLERHREALRLSVSDQGLGQKAAPRSSSGFGSRMIAATVGRMGGAIDYEDSPAGLKVVLTTPIEP